MLTSNPLKVQDKWSGCVMCEKSSPIGSGNDGSWLVSNCYPLKSTFHSVNIWRNFCSTHSIFDETLPSTRNDHLLIKSVTPSANPCCSCSSTSICTRERHKFPLNRSSENTFPLNANRKSSSSFSFSSAIKSMIPGLHIPKLLVDTRKSD